MNNTKNRLVEKNFEENPLHVAGQTEYTLVTSVSFCRLYNGILGIKGLSLLHLWKVTKRKLPLPSRLDEIKEGK